MAQSAGGGGGCRIHQIHLCRGVKLLYSHNHNIDQRTSMNERTNILLYKEYISHNLLSKGLMILTCVRDGWREDFFFPYLLPWARGCHRLLSIASSIRDASDRLRVHRSTAIICTLSKSDRVVFWSRCLLPVTHLFDLSDPTRRHLPVYKSKCDSLPKHTGSVRTNRKSMSYVI